jgi:(1->4)-alpha-D-glucan 1-alpha-D-glucosylmutase
MSKLNDLACAAGLQTHYQDAWGQRRDVPPQTIQAVLQALGHNAADEETAAQALEALRESKAAQFRPVTVVYEDEKSFTLTVPRGGHGDVAWTIMSDERPNDIRGGTGQVRSGSLRLLKPAGLPTGYYTLVIRHADRQFQTALIIAPRKCYQLPAFAVGERRWGIAVQLYAVKSPRNWGIGDFTDLAAILRRAWRAGAACIGVNPLHALFPRDPDSASPYSPNSRLFLNTLYIDVEAMEDCQEQCGHTGFIKSKSFQRELNELRTAALIDYPRVAACKERAFRALYRHFRSVVLADEHAPRAKAFRAFQQDRGPLLREFAIFAARTEASADTFDPVAVEYHEYLQWEASLQLQRVQDVARRLNMSIGLYQDLAVGMSGGGAEAFSNRDVIAAGFSIGAPPDLWNMKGQNWGLPPLNPALLTQKAYMPLRQLLSANMRGNGALRIDHILGFMRLFWIPEGASPAEGAYVSYPWKDLLAVLALESQRHQCVVIGEDLGTVPPELQSHLRAAGVLSTRVFYFEKDNASDDGTTVFRKPEDYPSEALITVGTHDLPTFKAYWAQADLDLRTTLKLWPNSDAEADARRERAADLKAVAAWLGQSRQDSAPTQALYKRLGSAPSQLIMVQMEDIAGQVDQVNVPGTNREHPNWRIRLRQNIDEILSDQNLNGFAKALAGRSESQIAHKVERSATPVATYRLQFSDDFTFDDAARIVPYLAALGITHIYASPWLKARPHSTHGYDVVDHNAINPAFGGADGLDNLTHTLQRHGLGHILDFVPNHMGVGSSNPYWSDILEFGRHSPYAAFFDISWRIGARHLRDKILLPILGEHYGDALEQGKLKLRFDALNGRFNIWYGQYRLPMHYTHYERLVQIAATRVDDTAARNALLAIASSFGVISDQNPPDARKTVRKLQRRLAKVCAAHGSGCDVLAADLLENKEPQQRLAIIHALLEDQHYHVAYWAAAADEINYRRFFNINDLAGLRMETRALFRRSHKLIGRLIDEGALQGLRIDHVDGLFNPLRYCTQLQELARRSDGDEPFYVLVEKILARHERLRQDWPVAGTTGYEFAVALSGLMVDSRFESAMTNTYAQFISDAPDFVDILRESKIFVIDAMFRAELQVLSHRLHRLAQTHWRSRDYTRGALKLALREIVIHFPVYRTYVGDETTAEDRRDIDWAVAQARKSWRAPGREVLDFVYGVITADFARSDSGYEPADVIRFARRFQQFTSPIMAKSVEDTAFYRYVRLAALNEVGGEPRHFGASPAAVHRFLEERSRHHPHALNTTATHDTKRGEDTRARMLAISELPKSWAHEVRKWATLNARHKTLWDNAAGPDANDEYLLYQTLVGAWPAGKRTDAAFTERINAYMLKAIREAKRHTSWDNPNTEYEAAVAHFVTRILDRAASRLFLDRFLKFQGRIARLGVVNSLAQLVIKICAPGVPDFYQGAELWDFSLVDPDNRRPVDYNARVTLLADLENRAAMSEVLSAWTDSRIKLHVAHRLLALRNESRALFQQGDYRPLQAAGLAAENVFGFTRSLADAEVAVLVLIQSGALTDGHTILPTPQAWGDTHVMLSKEAQDVLTGQSYAAGEVPAHDLFSMLPVVVLRNYSAAV